MNKFFEALEGGGTLHDRNVQELFNTFSNMVDEGLIAGQKLADVGLKLGMSVDEAADSVAEFGQQLARPIQIVEQALSTTDWSSLTDENYIVAWLSMIEAAANGIAGAEVTQ